MATEVVKSLNDHRNLGIKLIVGRVGNVIGGGDQSENRLLPDIAESFILGAGIQLRNPDQVRPWQHMLELISVYLSYINCSNKNIETPSALNFGPNKSDHLTVKNVAKMTSNFWDSGKSKITFLPTNLPQENNQILLNSDLARKTLNWLPKWDAKNAIHQTVNWWNDYFNLNDKRDVSKLYEKIQLYFFNNNFCSLAKFLKFSRSKSESCLFSTNFLVNVSKSDITFRLIIGMVCLNFQTI